MNNKRKYGVLAFVVFWAFMGGLLTGFPFKIGTQKIYSMNEGCGTQPYKDLNIANLQRIDYLDWASFCFGGHPKRGPYGTTFDMVNYRKSGGPFANASWNSVHFGSGDFQSDFYGPVNPHKVKLPDTLTVTKYIKELAKYSGSCAVGVADLGKDPIKWFFKNDWTGRPLYYKPEEHRYAVVTLHIEELADHPFPQGMSMSTMRYYTKVAQCYFFDDYVAGQVAQYIRSLGYHAIGHNNGYVRSEAVAVLAGLGEIGRSGMLMTKQWGPNVRISTITTDIPLVPDKPIDMGVQDLCSICTRCYDYCPSNAVPAEKGDSMGVNKWTVNQWRCRHNIQVGMDDKIDASTCTLCRDVCPYAKPEEYWTNRLGRAISARSHFGRKFLVKLDHWLYSDWNKHDLRNVITERRKRIKETYLAGFPDKSALWMTEGAYSEAARHKYATEIYPGGNMGGAGVSAFGLMFPLYSEADMKRPEFGKWPTWYDPWGRKIAGWQDGENGAPKLDFRAVENKIPTVALSGYGPTIIDPDPTKPTTTQRYHAYGILNPMTPGY